MTLEEIVAEYMPSDQAIRKMTDFFSVFAQDTRIRIVSLLTISPLNVSDIGRILNLNQTTTSHQLRILKDRRIVTTQRCGKEIQYAIANGFISDLLLQAVKITESYKTETLADLFIKRRTF